MAKNYTSDKLSLFLAEQFNESFYEPEPTSIGYVFVGNNVAYADELNPDEIENTWQDEREVWDNMLAAKRISGSDINIVLPVVEWTSGTIYDQYDDSVDMTTKNFYVVDSTTRRVWKCLFNNNGVPSTVRPTINPTAANKGVVRPTADRYLWKYMFTYPLNSKFTSLNYIPIPLSQNTSGYGTSYSYLDQNAIYNLVIDSPGTGYARATINASDFGANKNTITLSSLTGVANGMFVTGTNVATGTFVSSIIVGQNKIILSTNTTPAGAGTYAGSNNPLTFTPRVVISGDGSGATVGTSTLQSVFTSGQVRKLEMSTFGSGYTRANATIFAAGTGAVIRPVISPKFGHGYNPAKELGASSVMIATKLGDGDSTEGGIISDSTTFRQFGFLRDPHKYGNTTPVNSTTANNAISQLHEITLVTGNPYTINEFVYQGPNAANSTFSGYVVSQSTSVIRLSKVKGSFSLGQIVTGQTSLITRNAIKIKYPEFQPYTGDILYVRNFGKVQRISGQAELLRFVLTF